MANITSTLLTNSVYSNNKNIVSVDLDYVPWQNNSMYSSFANCTNLTSVSNINENVTDMGAAFMLCTNLVNISSIPPNVTDLSYAFEWASSITSIPTIPNSVTNVAYGFMDCSNLTTLPSEMPQNITNYAYAFGGCSNLTVAPNINAHLADNLWVLFQSDTNLQSSNIVIGPNALYIYGMYNGCSNLTHVNLTYSDYNNTTKTLDVHEMFSNCSKLSSFPKLPPLAQNLYRTFYNCQLLTHFDCPQSALNMGYAFYNCRNLQQITIPNSVINIAGAFQNCYQFTTAKIPTAVYGSMANAYYDCYNVNRIDGNIPETVNNVAGSFYNCKNISGDIFIHSNLITNAINCFYNTTFTKNVYIPFYTSEDTESNLYCWVMNSTNEKIYIKEDFSTSSGSPSKIFNADGTEYTNYRTVSMSYGSGQIRTKSPVRTYTITYTPEHDIITIIPAGSNTKTHDAFINAGYDTNGTKCGVYLKDINTL